MEEKGTNGESKHAIHAHAVWAMSASGATDLFSKNQGVYAHFVKQCTGQASKMSKIARDVHRTLQKTPEEAQVCLECQCLLRNTGTSLDYSLMSNFTVHCRILTAHTLLNKVLGYCQEARLL